MMAPRIDFTAPLPFFYHAASERVLYVAHGPSPSPLVFSIAIKDVLRHELICRGPVQTYETHPFGTKTGISSLVEELVRRGLAESEAFDDLGALEDILLLWRDFCDAVAERLQTGEDLEPALAKTWVLENSHDIDLNDLAANSAATSAAEPHGGAA
jgi:hypothetical protein